MHSIQTIESLKSYRVTLIPPGANASDVEDLADAGQLPTIRIKAATSEQAELHAHVLTGKNVLRADRVES